MQLLQAHTREEAGWTIVEVAGQLDVATAPDFRQVLLEAQYGGASQVVVDVAGVEFVDSMGLGVLIGAHKRARSHDGASFVLARPSERMRHLLALTGLDTVLTVVADPGEVLGTRS
ncbi:MAG TPA: STAS domain-containing protein [Egicoccus sp.]|nr:STAS domain-containing protein [Egicoccus sp.]HSK23939.1 STAS domain-containing protein [Egicoccus sp.]